MSDVLVKGMAMPDGCWSCPFYNGTGCKATWKKFPYWHNMAVRPSYCPLVEVKTPHGRLIDGTDLYVTLDEGFDVDLADLPETKDAILGMIASAETIVEADYPNCRPQ